MDATEKFVVAVLVLFSFLVGIMLFLYVPVMMYSDAECLRAGYPKAHVTVGLERYCSTLDGAVTIKVQPQE